MNTQILTVVVISFLLVACTNKDLYNATQDNREANCRTLPPQDAEFCLRDLNDKSYDEYEKQRQKLLKNSN